MYVCLCQAVTQKQVRQLGLQGIDTADALVQALHLDDEECCGLCMHHIERIVAIARGMDPLPASHYRLVHDPDPADQE
jgi:bacterioferritin-associated ferredoxin